MKSIRSLAIAVVISIAPLAAHAVPIVVLDGSNVGIDAGTFSFNVTGTTITVTENWTSNGLGALLFFDLLRFDVAHDLRHRRWSFGIDIDRGFWGVM